MRLNNHARRCERCAGTLAAAISAHNNAAENELLGPTTQSVQPAVLPPLPGVHTAHYLLLSLAKCLQLTVRGRGPVRHFTFDQDSRVIPNTCASPKFFANLVKMIQKLQDSTPNSKDGATPNNAIDAETLSGGKHDGIRSGAAWHTILKRIRDFTARDLVSVLGKWGNALGMGAYMCWAVCGPASVCRAAVPSQICIKPNPTHARA